MFQLERENPTRHRARCSAWTCRHAIWDDETHAGNEGDGGNARDALEQLDTFRPATFRSAVGLIGYIVLDRPDCQYAAKTVEVPLESHEARLDADCASGQVPGVTQ